MNWLKSIQKRAWRQVAGLMGLIALVTLVGFLVRILERGLLAVLGETLEGGLLAVLGETLERSLLTALGWILAWFLVSMVKDRLVARETARGTALEKEENNGPGLILPPGTWLKNVLHTLYPPKTAERVFDQTIADMQLEWQEAMIHDRKWLANWIQVRGVLTVLLTVLAHTVTALGSIFKLVK